MLKTVAIALLLCSAALAGPRDYTLDEVLSDVRARNRFLADYVRAEAPFFRQCRSAGNGLTYDGVDLDRRSGQIEKIRSWSAASKECLDIAVLVKCLQGNPLASLLLSEEEAAQVLQRKIDGLWSWTEGQPGYNGFLPWFHHDQPLRAANNWRNRIPGLDNGEMFFAMLVAERELRRRGYTETADSYAEYLQMVNGALTRLYYDPVAGLVRGDVELEHPQAAGTEVKKEPRPFYMTGEHGVHEGIMLVLWVTLFAEGLPPDAADRIWSQTKMVRVEHPYGTTWQGYWGSSHESWHYLFLPMRDVAGFADLFRIREKIRYQNAVQRGYPGLATSCLAPAPAGYLDGAGIEGVGSQPIRNNHTFALYGAFPGLLYFSQRPQEPNFAAAWLLNMLQAPRMLGPLGAGESGRNDGTDFGAYKTIDGTHSVLLALMGGLEQETRAALQERGVYERFCQILQREYDETFGSRPLREPCDFIAPRARVPEGLGEYR